MPEKMLYEQFCDLALDCLSLWSWQYDDTLSLITSNCPAVAIYAPQFVAQYDHVRSLRRLERMPAVIATDSGMAWIVTIDGRNYNVLGPVHLASATKNEDSAPDFEDVLPVFGMQELSRYATMLHRTLNQSIKTAYLPGDAIDKTRPSASMLLLARLQNKVRNGEYDYKELVLEVLTNRQSLYELGAISQNSAKQVAELSMALCRQAALEGGLTAQTIDTLYDEHLPKIHAARYACEIALLCHVLLYHLVRLVRRAKHNTTVSDPVQACCTYIEEHANEKFSLYMLSRQVSYSPDHLSKRFKAEKGVSIKNYILQVKIHRAQLMLATTRLSIGDISLLLSFSSSSHFTKIFHQITQETPAVYRLKNNHSV